MPRDAKEEERIETGLQEGGRFRSPPQIIGGGREQIKEENEEREHEGRSRMRAGGECMRVRSWREQ